MPEHVLCALCSVLSAWCPVPCALSVCLCRSVSLEAGGEGGRRRVARRGNDEGVAGLNCLNSSMGGQTGNRSVFTLTLTLTADPSNPALCPRSAEQFAAELSKGGFGDLPLLQAGGVAVAHPDPQRGRVQGMVGEAPKVGALRARARSGAQYHGL